MALLAQACLFIFVTLLVESQVLKANPIPNYEEQDDMLLYGTAPSTDVEELTLMDFDRWTPVPVNSTDMLPNQHMNNGMIDRMMEKIRGWTNSSYNTVKSWGQKMKRKFCSYECFQQYSRVAKFCNKQVDQPVGPIGSEQ